MTSTSARIARASRRGGQVLAPPGGVSDPVHRLFWMCQTMTGRDEEPFPSQFLASAAGLHAEIVVIDTGSRDRTIDVEQSFEKLPCDPGSPAWRLLLSRPDSSEVMATDKVRRRHGERPG